MVTRNLSQRGKQVCRGASTQVANLRIRAHETGVVTWSWADVTPTPVPRRYAPRNASATVLPGERGLSHFRPPSGSPSRSSSRVVGAFVFSMFSAAYTETPRKPGQVRDLPRDLACFLFRNKTCEIMAPTTRDLDVLAVVLILVLVSPVGSQWFSGTISSNRTHLIGVGAAGTAMFAGGWK
jgi:hypothetical protein